MYACVLLYYQVCKGYIREVLPVLETVLVKCCALIRTQVWMTAQSDDITTLAS